MTNPPQVASPPPQPALEAADVENLFSTLGKALRAFNMYQSNNPVFQRFQDAVRQAFEDIWRKADALEVTVDEDGFKWNGVTFAVGKGRDSLSFAFYKDGIRFLTFLPGFEEEVGTFLDAVNRAGRRDEESDDLIAVLWEEDFTGLQYGYVDLLSEGLSLPEEPRGEPDGADGLAVRAAVAEADGEEAGGAAGGGAPGVVKMEDFDDTLYFLDHSEMAALQTEVELEMERELRRDVLNALFDRLEEPGRPERPADILDILDQLLPLMLSRGDMENATRILRELDASMEQGGAVTGPLRERVERLFARLSDPGVLEQFVQALEDGAVQPDSEQVNLFFARLQAAALPVLIRFSETSESAGVKNRLASAIDGLASRYPSEVGRLLRSDEPALVAGAARVAGRVGLAQAVPALHEALRHPDREVRMAVVESLVAIRLTPALNALTVALSDDDRDVRIAAARALAAVRFASARDRLSAAIDDRRMKEADLTEKMAFFEAYGAVGGSAAVERLETILSHKGLLGRRHPTELRACAALGLGQAGTPGARQALENARGDEDPVVRNAVLQALRQERPQ